VSGWWRKENNRNLIIARDVKMMVAHKPGAGKPVAVAPKPTPLE
jgi:hypothetical protein